MANTIREGNTIIQLILDGDWTSSFHNFASCKFKPSAANDILVIKECPVETGSTSIATADWPEIHLQSATGDTIECSFKGKRRSKLHIPYSDCTFSAPTTVAIAFEIF